MSWEKLGVAGALPKVGTGESSAAREGTGEGVETPRPPGHEAQSKRVSGEAVAGEARAAERGREGEGKGGTRDSERGGSASGGKGGDWGAGKRGLGEKDGEACRTLVGSAIRSPLIRVP